MKAEKMFAMTRELVEILGMNTTRLRLEWISSAEGVRFAEIVRDFTEELLALGPSNLKQAA